MTLLVVEIGVPETIEGAPDDPAALLGAFADKGPVSGMETVLFSHARSRACSSARSPPISRYCRPAASRSRQPARRPRRPCR